jgi:hypothetical protein
VVDYYLGAMVRPNPGTNQITAHTVTSNGFRPGNTTAILLARTAEMAAARISVMIVTLSEREAKR